MKIAYDCKIKQITQLQTNIDLEQIQTSYEQKKVIGLNE